MDQEAEEAATREIIINIITNGITTAKNSIITGDGETGETAATTEGVAATSTTEDITTRTNNTVKAATEGSFNSIRTATLIIVGRSMAKPTEISSATALMMAETIIIITIVATKETTTTKRRRTLIKSHTLRKTKEMDSPHSTNRICNTCLIRKTSTVSSENGELWMMIAMKIIMNDYYFDQ